MSRATHVTVPYHTRVLSVLSTKQSRDYTTPALPVSPSNHQQAHQSSSVVSGLHLTLPPPFRQLTQATS